MKLELIAYYIGIFIVFVSHLYMLVQPDAMSTKTSMQIHAVVNLVGASLIAYYFMKTEKYI